jgi:zinc transporter ZupT
MTSAGIFVISKYELWAQRYAAHIKSFAAGMLITITFAHIIPRSFQMQEIAPTFLVVGFLAIYVANRILKLRLSQAESEVHHPIGVIPVLGIGFHSLVDGVILSVTFNVSIFTGILAATAMVLHELPEGIIAFVLLYHGGFDTRRSRLYAFLIAALSTPLGTLISYPFVHRVGDSALGTLLALAGGALIYVAATHLLPGIDQESKGHSLLTLAAGVALAAVILSLGE